ncbi:erythromycin esterase family protein [Halomicrobium urmianum]|uniref:erythromycin esterase family protein n=1 Tax=Halomicrobium urmianum TaxID=1586233 RepID=UPI001CDA2E7A|nr:erythromycin esterase family protein [Halomicrobium urmianum]
MSSLQRGNRREEGLDEAVDAVRRNARGLAEPADLDPIVEAAADRSYVLIGEASHGTSEFYRWRARLTARLIRETDVAFVGVEGDWTDCFAVNRHVRGYDDAPDETREVLHEFDRWPTWMWANWEVAEFVEWLREHNDGRDLGDQTGFYGIDVYNLFESMDAVVDYLEGVDLEGAERARDAYHCFEPYGEDAREYARETRLVPENCEAEVLDVLTDVRERARSYDADGPEAEFDAEQNALVAKNAEAYYRAMVSADEESWNVRDEHMMETVDRLLDRPEIDGTAVVWAHNTHVGDARATDMVDRGRLNVGQLARERHGADDVLLVGFGTHHGSVVAGDAWDAPMEEMTVPRAQDTSYEDVFDRAGVGDSYLLFDDVDDPEPLARERGHRAIGVVYHPKRELGNYVPTDLPERYDAYLHVQESSALHPMHMEPYRTEAPDTFPWGV